MFQNPIERHRSVRLLFLQSLNPSGFPFPTAVPKGQPHNHRAVLLLFVCFFFAFKRCRNDSGTARSATAAAAESAESAVGRNAERAGSSAAAATAAVFHGGAVVVAVVVVDGVVPKRSAVTAPTVAPFFIRRQLRGGEGAGGTKKTKTQEERQIPTSCPAESDRPTDRPTADGETVAAGDGGPVHDVLLLLPLLLLLPRPVNPPLSVPETMAGPRDR